MGLVLRLGLQGSMRVRVEVRLLLGGVGREARGLLTLARLATVRGRARARARARVRLRLRVRLSVRVRLRVRLGSGAPRGAR